MFYEPDKRNHGLAGDPFKAIVAPRPIGWITSIDARGNVNLAPYSFFNGINSRPALVMFASAIRRMPLATSVVVIPSCVASPASAFSANSG